MKVCVFGASSDDIRDVYVRETEHLGELMGQNDMDLVFGGGQHGLMGAVARGVRRSNGRVISISPFIFNEDGICTEVIAKVDTKNAAGQILG